MDLAFKHFSRRRPIRMAPDFGALLGGLAARQTASATSMAQAALQARAHGRAPVIMPMIALFAATDVRIRPPCGTFNARVATMLTGSKPT